MCKGRKDLRRSQPGASSTRARAGSASSPTVLPRGEAKRSTVVAGQTIVALMCTAALLFGTAAPEISKLDVRCQLAIIDETEPAESLNAAMHEALDGEAEAALRATSLSRKMEAARHAASLSRETETADKMDRAELYRLFVLFEEATALREMREERALMLCDCSVKVGGSGLPCRLIRAVQDDREEQAAKALREFEEERAGSDDTVP